MWLFAAFVVAFIGVWYGASEYKRTRQPKALEPSEADVQIIKALKEGTLTDEDLEGIGIDAQTFRRTYMPPTKQELIREFGGRLSALYPHRQYLPLREARRNLQAHVGGITGGADICVRVNGTNIQVQGPFASLSINTDGAHAPIPPVPPVPPVPPIMPMRPMRPVFGDAEDMQDYADEIREWEQECRETKAEWAEDMAEYHREKTEQQREYKAELHEYAQRKAGQS